MKFVIISHVPHGIESGNYFAYGPYVREMNIWNKFADEVVVVAPLELQEKSNIHINYDHANVTLKPIAGMNLLNAQSVFRALWNIPKTSYRIFTAMKSADHIHLRCPGNIGLLGCFIQILFPNKKKTAKYAGNWDPRAKQPKSYKLQQWILNNTLLTKNMTVLVYGQWEDSSKNIKSFFTATYKESDKMVTAPRPLKNTIKFLFVGSLAPGKRPLYALNLVEKLAASGHEVRLELYGEGKERAGLEKYIAEHRLTNIRLMGNQNEAVVRDAYQSAHFLILPSQSEGWPKVVAEAMFWGCLPLATPVSCVPFMLGQQSRGLLLQMDPENDTAVLNALIENPVAYEAKASEAMSWSRKYTLDLFEANIKTLVTV